MSLVLTTQPQILRTHFGSTRRRLVGKNAFSVTTVVKAIKKTEHDALVFLKKTGLIVLKAALTGVLLASIVVIGSLVVPEAFNRFFPEKQNQVVSEAHQPSTLQAEIAPVVPEVKEYQPAFDASLPEGTWISIPTIGVDTLAQPTVDSTEALNTGVWLVPDFGRPGDKTQPIIMAAHRFGWKSWWQTDYWKKNSFYLLTETVPGDKIEVIHEQRKWVYEIYSGEEGTEISDYDADLILYTCKFLNSPIRYFRYAKLVENV